jgi:hypothetical protein
MMKWKGVGWMNLAEDTDKWLVRVKTVVDVQVT